jgi:hypothetical protein
VGWNDLSPELNSGVPGQQGLRSEEVRIARLRHQPRVPTGFRGWSVMSRFPPSRTGGLAKFTPQRIRTSSSALRPMASPSYRRNSPMNAPAGSTKSPNPSAPAPERS